MGIGTAQAQTAQQPLGFKLMYGQQSYRGDLGNEIFQYTGNDPLVGVGMSAYLNRYFGVALEAQYLPLDKKNGPGDAVFKKRNTYFKTDDFNMNLTLHIKPFKTRLNPYAAIGVGGNFLKAKDNITKKDHHFMFTLPFGAGINYKINSLLMLNVEAIYHRGFNDWKIDHYPMPNSKATQYAINHEPQHNFNRNIDGKNHDDFFTTSVGLVFNFGGGKSKKSIQERMLEQSMKNLKAAQNASDQASNTLQQAQQLNDKTLAALDSLKAARHQSQQKAQELKSELGEIVNNVQFAFDKSNIIDPAKKELNSLANILNHFPSLNVNIAGHADKR
ncbi:MAG TPA: outer membrane beta-barrel protein, partial [Balneolaceae bacterium]|nr:outer membrane beta-barrel protein [Balneolaceae bacterium]